VDERRWGVRGSLVSCALCSCGTSGAHRQRTAPAAPPHPHPHPHPCECVRPHIPCMWRACVRARKRERVSVRVCAFVQVGRSGERAGRHVQRQGPGHVAQGRLVPPMQFRPSAPAVMDHLTAATPGGRFSPTVGIWFQIFLNRHEQFDKWLKQARKGETVGGGC
jgi:hypothetical protein